MRKNFVRITILCAFLLFYSFLYRENILPLERRTIPYAASDPTADKRYAYYTITDESGALELMRVPLLVQIDDEVLADDNKLYRVVRIEEDRAYAKFIRQVKL